MSYRDQEETTPTQQNPASKPKKKRWLRYLLLSFFLILLSPFIAFGIYAALIWSDLPDASELKQVSYQVPLRIVTADNKLITEIGEKRREPLNYHEIPQYMTQAIIAAEDERFYTHWGVDFKGLGRAVYELATTGSKQSGGSTITMQVARNFYLSSERSYERKLKEIVLSFKIEKELTKQEILALYLNKIFLGHRSYGVAAAAKTYFAKDIKDLELHEFATLAGLPKAPSAYNPIANPKRATQRRHYVLQRMNKLGFITRDQMLLAQNSEMTSKITGVQIEVEAGYIAEMARQFALENFGEDALNLGLTIVTTLDSQHQKQANLAIRNGLQNYEKRHGYRGAIKRLAPTTLTNRAEILTSMEEISTPGNLKVATVIYTNEQQAQVLTADAREITLNFQSMEWAAPFVNINTTGKTPESLLDILKVGDVIYIERQADLSWELAQDPNAEASLVSLDPKNGRIYALVGGYDYFKSRFNRATQSKRQLGSAFKPHLYSAALDRDYTAATVVNDAPVVFHDAMLEDTWRPENITGRFYGPTRIRNALAYSRNLVPIRVLQDIGINPVIRHAAKIGFPLEELNKHKNLSLALGSAQISPLEAARSYATFANGGFLIDPYYVQEVRDFHDRLIYQADPKKSCQYQCYENDPSLAPRVITPQNAFIMTSMMQDAIRIGTGRAANVLNRQDLAGKTGTTNRQFDAWFVGYNPDVTTSVWVGFDNPSSLGQRETAGRAALPIWIDYMSLAVQNSPNVPFLQPEGLVNIPIDPSTGIPVPANTRGAIFEIFYEQSAPEIPDSAPSNIQDLTRELFQ